jgi:hypothetical protein
LSSPQFRNTFGVWELHQAARKHGIPDKDTVHAATHALACYPLDDEDPCGPLRELRLDPDRSGNFLELVILLLDDGRKLIIYSMRMRPKYRPLLP